MNVKVGDKIEEVNSVLKVVKVEENNVGVKIIHCIEEGVE